MLVNYLYNQSIYFPIFSIKFVYFFPPQTFLFYISVSWWKKNSVATKVWLLVFVQYMLGNFL